MSSAEKETFEERFLSRAELVFSLLWDALPIILPLATTTLFTISTMQSEKWTGLCFRFGLGVTVLTVLVQLVQRSLFSGRLGVFPGSNIMMVRSHEVQWVLK